MSSDDSRVRPAIGSVPPSGAGLSQPNLSGTVRGTVSHSMTSGRRQRGMVFGGIAGPRERPFSTSTPVGGGILVHLSPPLFACNPQALVDDEYFRDTVVKYHRVADIAEATDAMAAGMRAVPHPRTRGYTQVGLETVTAASLGVRVRRADRLR